eukprot:11983567-Ditylum_brightwellii.AAC.1
MLVVDSGASATFTYNKSDFRYTITNDNEENVQLLVSNTFHILDIPVRLLCPQQAAQQSRDPLAGGYATKTDFLLSWDYN